MKHLLFAILGAAAVLAVGMSYSPAADAKVFGHNRATDNGDSCYTPEEINGLRTGNFEKIAAYSGDDAVKFKQGLMKVYPDVTLEQLTWVEIDGYKFVAPDGKTMVLVTIFNKEGDNICASGGGPVPEDEWNKIVTAAGLAPVASQIHLGFVGKLNK